jgi:membrane-bound serine protease (ClpP class)
MDILLNPNVAYLLLVVGTLLALLAIVTPGTGMLEVGALFCLVLAGYAVYNISFNWWALAILVISLVPFLYAIRQPKREAFLIVAICGMIIGSVFFFAQGETPSVNPFLAIVVSASYAVFLWISIRKVIQTLQVRPTHDLTALIGLIGLAKTSILEDGSVQVAGELWSARSNKAVTAGSPVRVVGRDGFVLVIENMDTSK